MQFVGLGHFENNPYNFLFIFLNITILHSFIGLSSNCFKTRRTSQETHASILK